MESRRLGCSEAHRGRDAKAFNLGAKKFLPSRAAPIKWRGDDKEMCSLS